MSALRFVALIGVGLMPILAATDAAAANPYQDAWREQAFASGELRAYQRIEHAAELRRLRAAIELARAEARALNRRLSQYERFNRFKTGSAVSFSVEYTRLELLAARMRLRELREELSLSQRIGPERARLVRFASETPAARAAYPAVWAE